MLRDSLIHTQIKGADDTALLIGATWGSTNLFAADHVFDEVEEHLGEWAGQKQLTEPELRDVWEQSYLPLIRFVDVSQIEAADSRVRKITSDDHPTGVLGELIGPTHVLTDDNHLVKYGVGDARWIKRATQGRDVAGGAVVMQFGGMTIYASAEGVVTVAKRVGKAVETVNPLLLMTLALIAGAILHRYWTQGRARDHIRAVTTGFEFVAEAFGPLVLQGSIARLELEQTSFVPESRSVVGAIARSLAIQPGPLTVAGIHRELERMHPGAVPPDQIEANLRIHRTFEEAPAGNWRLGRLRLASPLLPHNVEDGSDTLS